MFGHSFLQCRGPNVVLFWGAFKPNGSNPVDATTLTSGMGVGPACGFSVSRTATGVFTVVLNEPYPFLVNLQVTGVNLGANWVEARSFPGSLAAVNGKNLLIANKVAAGTDTDLAAATDRWIMFLATLRTKVATL